MGLQELWIASLSGKPRSRLGPQTLSGLTVSVPVPDQEGGEGKDDGKENPIEHLRHVGGLSSSSECNLPIAACRSSRLMARPVRSADRHCDPRETDRTGVSWPYAGRRAGT